MHIFEQRSHITSFWSTFGLVETVEAMEVDDEWADTCVSEKTVDDVEGRTLLIACKL